jgi:3D-(3,5/4)-trihydroxycyclohexane-1,2-dione acylhydrolase (decyclizing)
MGHEIPAGIGYRLARKDNSGDVFVLIGDGTYLMQPTELVTAVQEHQKIIVIVLDNAGHQCIVGTQFAKTGVEFGTQLRERNPETGRLDGPIVSVDFAANAASLGGCSAWTVTTPEEFAQALEEARAAEGPALICAQVEPSRYLSPNGAFWDVGVPLASGSEDTRRRVAVHEEGRKRQRFYGATTAPDASA